MHAEKSEAEAWAMGVLSEMIASGEVADNPLERLRTLFRRNFPKSREELHRSREVLGGAGIPEDALDFSQADMPITVSGAVWLKQWRMKVSANGDVP